VYFPKSRNLQRLKDPSKQILVAWRWRAMLFSLWHLIPNAAKVTSLLKHGRIDIVQFVRDLPKTNHHRELFEVDIMTFTVKCPWPQA